MLHGLLVSLALSAIVNGNPRAAVPRTIEMPVPTTRSSLTIQGNIGERPARPEAVEPGLTLSIPVDARGRPMRPADAPQMVELLWRALPADYRRYLAYIYGYARPGAPGNQAGLEARAGDLDRFLFDLWDLSSTRTRLGRELRCISPGEGDLTPIMVLVAERETLTSGYQRRADIPEDFHLEAQKVVARRLLFACSNGRPR